jgi:hypothetical protein
MIIELGEATTVKIGGVDVTGYLAGSVTLATSQHYDDVAVGGFGLTPIRIKMHGALTSVGYRVIFGRTHPRIRRMHSAYGRRRGRGRW